MNCLTVRNIGQTSCTLYTIIHISLLTFSSPFSNYFVNYRNSSLLFRPVASEKIFLLLRWDFCSPLVEPFQLLDIVSKWLHLPKLIMHLITVIIIRRFYRNVFFESRLVRVKDYTTRKYNSLKFIYWKYIYIIEIYLCENPLNLLFYKRGWSGLTN